MNSDLQRASMGKRISAWLFDIILLATVAVLFATVLSALLGYDNYQNTFSEACAVYEARYGVDFEITQEQYQAMTEQEKTDYQEAYNKAYEELAADADALYAYNMIINLSMLIASVGILLAVLVMEYVIPLCLKNGQTLGKKIFGIGIVRIDSVQVTPVQMFVRAFLGKYAVETMLPVFIVILLMLGSMGTMGLGILAVLLLAQIICPLVTREHRALHDFLAGTVAVDIASQRIFRSSQDLIEYTKKVHAERAAHQDY